jgi:peptide/nickel transport system substrate-binding protein
MVSLSNHTSFGKLRTSGLKSGFFGRGAGPLVVLTLLAVACAAPPAPSPGATSEQGGGPSANPTRIVVAISSEIKTLYQKLNPLSAQAGVAELEEMVNAGLTNPDPEGVRWPQLAEAAPTLQNGLWKLLPDGTMETTWTIREGARWHDGTPSTTDDLLFTLTVARDRDLRAFGDRTLDFIQDVIPKDARTITVRWRVPVYDADALFTRAHALPIPKHLLERAFLEEKASFTDHLYWSEAFVGAGPYQVREWVRGSHTVLEAFGGYVLGRAKIDEIEVKFIASSDTLVANVLAGTVEMNVGRGLSLDQALQIRDRWREGTMKHYPGSWMGIHPQLLNSSPAVVANVQFREALLRAIDRQQMADELLHGLSMVSHAFMSPDDEPYWSRLLPRVPRYDYDPRRATQMIEALGYSKRGDGFFYDESGQKLEVEIHTTADNDINIKSTFPVADYWKRLGVSTEAVVIPVQRQFDREYRATFPGFTIVRGPTGVAAIGNIHSSRAQLPENNFQVAGGVNYSRYMNPEYDALYDRFTATIPQDERAQVFEQIVLHLAQNQVKLGLFYDPINILVANRIENVAARRPVWNAKDWEVK